MQTVKAFRFGVVAAHARSGEEWVRKAQRIEELGYSTLVMPDGLRYTLSPLPALAAAAAATHTLRVGTYVIDNDYRNPVQLAKEAATLDFLSGGRLELGIGAGRPAAAEDNRMLGIPFESGGTRLARLAESLTIVKRLLEGKPASLNGAHYTVEGAQVDPKGVQQPRPPILIAGSGKQMLRLAAREADTVALGVQPTATEAEVAEKIGWLREAAGDRYAHIELNMNMMAVGQQIARYVASQVGVDAETFGRTGSASALVGSTQEMCDTLERRRETLGISYVVVGDELMEALAPVVERMSGR
jgi:probable F420-dependent oxidoreductase